MGFDPQDRFTESDKTCNVQDRIWRELVKLHVVNKEKPHEETRGQEGKDHREGKQETSP
jgi:hypothetical protein